MISLHSLSKCLPCIGSDVSEMISSSSSSFTNVGSTRLIQSASTSLVSRQRCSKNSKRRPTKQMPSPKADQSKTRPGTRFLWQPRLVAGLLRMNPRANPHHQTPELRGEEIRNLHPKQTPVPLPGRRTIKYSLRALIIVSVSR